MRTNSYGKILRIFVKEQGDLVPQIHVVGFFVAEACYLGNGNI